MYLLLKQIHFSRFHCRNRWLLIFCFAITLVTGAPAQCIRLRDDAFRLRKQPGALTKGVAEQAVALQTRWLKCGQLQDSSYVQLLLFTGNAYFDGGDYASAIIHYNRSIRVASNQISLQRLLLQSYYLLGTGYLYSGQDKQAKIALQTLLKKLKTVPESCLVGGQAYLNLAYLSFTNGDYQQAITYANDGQKLAEQVKNAGLVAQLLREKANALKALNQHKAAVPIAYEAIRLATKVNDQAGLSEYYQLVGDLQTKQNNVVEAKAAYRQAVRYCDVVHNESLKAVILNNLGFLYYSQGEYAESVQYHLEALDIQKNPFSRSRLFDNLGTCYWQMGQFEKALQTYQLGLICMPIGFSKSVATQNPPLQSVRLAARKEILLTIIQNKADTWLDYAKATDSNHQRLQHALETYQVADQMIDFMRWEHTGQQSKLYWRQKTRGMYERAIETCYRLNDAEQAFRFFEKSRAVMLADKLNELGARQQLAPQQVANEQRLRQEVSEQQTKLAGLSSGQAHDSLRTVLITQQDKLDVFLKQLEGSNPAYYRYKYDTTTAKLADLQRHLTTRKASFVTYFVGDSALYVLGVTGGRATLHRQAIGSYNQNAQAFMALLNDPVAMNKTTTITQFLALGNKLYRQLLAPLNLPEGAVIVSPDGSFIPFEVLSRSTREPDYLVKNYAFSYEYSARRLLRHTGNSSRMAGLGKRDFIGVAPVTFAPALKQVSLPGSDEALKPIADHFNASSLFTGPQATRRAFVAGATDARVIHLFTHATADTTNSEPLLYFADSTLRLSDLGDGELTHTQLVVLAACKTGVGANQRGEGVFSLARGFAALGVPSVLTTLWSVENKATYEITNLFYRYVDEGLPKDVALQRAKQDWLSTADGTNQLPNVWAGLILIGDTEPLSRPVQWAWVIGGALALLGAGGGALWLRRKRNRTLPPNTTRLTPSGAHSHVV